MSDAYQEIALLTVLRPSSEWVRRAACRGSNTSLFFGDDPDQILAAKAVCQKCPVVRECRDYARDTQEKYGVYGGLTPRERLGDPVK